MQHYEIDFEPDTVVVKRILDEEGDVFFVRNSHKEHIGQVTEGIVEVTRRVDGSVVILSPGDSITVRVGDEWDCVTRAPNTITSCRLSTEDPNTWLEIGMPRRELEQAKIEGVLEVRWPTRLPATPSPGIRVRGGA